MTDTAPLAIPQDEASFKVRSMVTRSLRRTEDGAASTEAPAGGLVEHAADDFRAWIRAMLIDLAEQAGAKDPISLGRQLHLIYDGAGLAGRMDHHDPGIPPTARHPVEALPDAAIPRSKPASKNH
jgi:hypothetical protein